MMDYSILMPISFMKTILLDIQMLPHLTGFVLIQTNPYSAYDTTATIAGARRIVSLFVDVEPAFDSARICIKIPSTWEGMQACRVLRAEGVNTLATTLFTLEQAQLAAEVGCRYVSPYVNELKVHFDKT
jgi:transaldolase